MFQQVAVVQAANQRHCSRHGGAIAGAYNAVQLHRTRANLFVQAGCRPAGRMQTRTLAAGLVRGVLAENYDNLPPQGMSCLHWREYCCGSSASEAMMAIMKTESYMASN